MSDADDVMVQPIRTFMEGTEVVQPSTKPYPVSRSRAEALRINGLVEWVEPEEEAPAAEPDPPTGGTAPAEPTPAPAPEAPKPRGRRAS